MQEKDIVFAFVHNCSQNIIKNVPVVINCPPLTAVKISVPLGYGSWLFAESGSR
jgi:hypothetical protein